MNKYNNDQQINNGSKTMPKVKKSPKSKNKKHSNVFQLKRS